MKLLLTTALVAGMAFSNAALAAGRGDCPEADTENYTNVCYGTLESFDDVNKTTYKVSLFKEVSKSDGGWSLRMVSENTAGGVIRGSGEHGADTLAAKMNADGKECEARGHFQEPKAGDARHVEMRLCQKGGKPDRVDLHLATRNADGSGKEPKSLSVEWEKVQSDS